MEEFTVDNLKLRIRSSTGSYEEVAQFDAEDVPKEKMKFSFWSVRITWIWFLWFVMFTWGELFASRFAIWSCKWADKDPREYHLAVIADPQLTDFYSYGMEKGSWTLWLTEFYSDLYMRRNFQLLAHRRDPPHGILLLGDLFDGGRILSRKENEDHVKRFNWIFGGHREIQFWNMSGNHDVGIKQWNNQRANEFYSHIFGQTQYSVVLGHIEVVVVDSIGMLSDDLAVKSEAFEFVQVYGSMRAKRQFPRILFTHIPLHRAVGSECGPRRRKAPIQPGAGVSYMNVMPKDISDMILEAVEPIHVFSGDDHTPCTYYHKPFGVMEDTLATFSWLQGERNPEFTMLSLQASTVNEPFQIETCALPDQMLIYFIYAGCGVLSVVYISLGSIPSKKISTPIALVWIVFPIIAWYFIVLVISIL